MKAEPGVLLFSDSDVYAGTEAHLVTLASALKEYDVRVKVACPPHSPTARRCSQAGLEIVPLAKQGMVDRRAVRGLVHELRQRGIRLLHAHNGRTSLQAALAISLAGRGSLVYTQHFMDPARTGRRSWHGLLSSVAHRWVNHRGRGVIAISDAVWHRMLDRRDCVPAKIRVIRNGIHDPLPSISASEANLARPFTIFTAARLEPEKNLEILIEAMGPVSRHLPGAVCLVAGEGSLRDRLAQLVQARGLSETVQFLGHRADIPTLMRSSDVFVLSSTSEPFGLAIVEAMALELPVIAANSGGPKEIVIQGGTGLLVPPKDADSLTRAIIALAHDPARRQAMGRAGRARFLQHFTAERMARETLSFYREILGA